MTLPVIHVGFHKAGSTTLQNALFARHSGIAYLGEPNDDPKALEAVSNAWDSCHRDPARRVAFDRERGRRLWQEAVAGLEPGKVPVFSKERLTLFDYCSHPGDAELPAKLREIVGPARIVIMTRHQIKLVESLYFAKTTGQFSPEHWLKAQTKSALWSDRFHVYRFHAFAKAYAEAFGRENVGVFMLEDMATNVESFARRLCAFMGIDPEEGVNLLQGRRFHGRARSHSTTTRGMFYSKFRNVVGARFHIGKYVPARLVKAFSGFLRRGSRVDIGLPPAWIENLESHYRADNRRLAEEWAVPLEKYGYPL